MQFLSDGTIDPTFGATIDPGGTVNAVNVLEDGRVLVAGEMFTTDGAAIARLLSDGSIDESFDRSVYGIAQDLNLFDDGRILVAGRWLYSLVLEGEAPVWVLASAPLP